MAYQCQHCGAAVTLAEPIPRESSCESCRRDYRACRQCRHYDPAYHNACREPEADMVEDKERRNFCEYFAFNPTPFRGSGADRARQAEARAKLEGLFGGLPRADARGGEARKKLEELFRKPNETA